MGYVVEIVSNSMKETRKVLLIMLLYLVITRENNTKNLKTFYIFIKSKINGNTIIPHEVMMM